MSETLIIMTGIVAVTVLLLGLMLWLGGLARGRARTGDADEKAGAGAAAGLAGAGLLVGGDDAEDADFERD